MHSVVGNISSWFWNPDIWLPPNVTWDNFKETKVLNNAVIEPENYAKFSDLWYPIPMAFVMIIIRRVVEKLMVRPIGVWMGLRDNKRKLPAENSVLEKTFRRSHKVTRKEVLKLSKETGMTNIQVKENNSLQYCCSHYKAVAQWLRQRKLSSLPNKLQKFCETVWRWVFYTTILLYGFKCLLDKPWLWNMRYCWYEYPYHEVDQDVWLYYMVELSFYWSLVITQFFDVRRKDFWEMFIHHNITIALMMFSWSTHFTRIGTLVLIIHDCSDHLLELAKILRYINYKHSCDVVFGIFALVWLVTRCCVFPCCILYSTLQDAGDYIEMFPAYYIFNTLLIILQLLNITWTFFILKIIRKAVTKGEMEDSRSDSEESSDEEAENKKDI